MTQSSSSPVSPAAVPTVKDRVQLVINWLRPVIQSDGGDIELVDVSAEGVVQVRLHGACVGCPSSEMTLRQGIERNIREKVPEVSQVVALAQ
jgi:Fe-S cluster biogenesis protein NfuA